MTKNFLSRSKGVIHVGANQGQERFDYKNSGLNVVWVEALPEAYNLLIENIAGLAAQSAIQALVTDVVGETYKFNVANNNGESSSILNFAKHRDIWPSVDFVREIDLVSTTLDHLAAEGMFDVAMVDALVLDTQGSELLVLKGGEAVLKSIRFLKIEAADFEAYEGCATVQELSNWCQAQGFHLISKVAFAEHPTGGTYFDLFFERVFDNEALLRAADELQALAGAFDSLGMSEIGASIANAASALDARVPEPPGWWSGPFNGQEGRKALVLTALQRLQPRSILETGTFRGTTTRFFAENFSGPVYTCEIDKRWYLTAQRSFLGFPSIEIDLDDSRAFLLRKLANVEGPVLIYLDAHWSSDLPLAREIEIIISSSIDAVVFIDDFAVPGDRGYSFDDYGPGKRLTIELLNTVDPKGAGLFFPTLSSANETGAKRGCAVIATGSGIHVLDHIDALKREPWPVTWPEAARPVPVGSNDMVYPPVASIHRLIGSTGMRDPLNYNVGVAAKPRMHPVHLRALLQSMYSSSSWRYTRPLRALAGLLGRPPATEIDIARLDEAGLLRLVEDMRRSTSWRLMAPLRLAKRLKVRLTRGPLALEQNDPSRTIVMGTDRSISRDDWTAIAAALDVKAIEHQPDTPAEGFIHSGIYDITAIASLYKGGRFIESFLRNITQQSWFHRSELIIIDADSPDGEADVILGHKLIKGDSQITFVLIH